MGLVDRLGPRGTSPLPVGVRARPWSPMLETLLPAGVGPAWRHGHGGGGPRTIHAGLMPWTGAGALGLATAGGLVGGS